MSAPSSSDQDPRKICLSSFIRRKNDPNSEPIDWEALYKQRFIEQIKNEATHITQRQSYEKHDPDEIDNILMKKDPNTYDYTSNDFWNLGKYRIDQLITTHGPIIFNHYNPKSKDKSKFKPALLATYLQVKYPLVTIKPAQYTGNDPGDMWLYHPEKEMYLPNAELYLGKVIKEIYQDEFTSRLLTQTFENIRYDTYIEREQFTLDPQYIPIANGILWTQKLDNEWVIELAENTPELYVTTRIPTHYDPEANAPRWNQFLNEILPNQKRKKMASRIRRILPVPKLVFSQSNTPAWRRRQRKKHTP